MCKLTVSLPTGWDTKLIMHVKDFALLCDIVERSRGFSPSYHAGEYYNVAIEPNVSASMIAPGPVITQAEFDAIKARPQEVTE